MSVKITDLVDQQTIDKIIELNAEIQNALDTYTTAAKDMAKGLNVNVKVAGDLDRLEKLLVEKSREAVAANRQLTDTLGEQARVIGDTTPVISRMLMEKERVNKLSREEYSDGTKVKGMLADVVDEYDNKARMLVKVELQIKANKEEQKKLEAQYKNNLITEDAYIERQSKLIATSRNLAVQKSNLTQVMKIEEKMNEENESSYNHLSQQLELLKKTYKQLDQTQREGDYGREMERAIQDLDAHLKDLAADMGEFQRNVGNYAIAGQNGVISTESLNAVLERQAVTMQDVADQTKILEEAKRMLDTSDEHYSETLDRINAQIDENKARLMDVSDIMEKEASTAAEAEAQNKRLQEAMKHIDVTSEGAQERIDELNARIERNNEVIDRASPTTERLAREQKELAEAAKKAGQEEKKLTAELEKSKKANEDLASQMLSLVGINENFASSLSSIQSSGDVWEGLGTKVKAFGKTLTGLLANPWVLTFLGIAGVGATFKWWYDYNKGLIEASRLTENFTGLTGDAADKVTNDVMVMADSMGKGFDQTIGAANTLVQQFGMSWEEALQKIQNGIAAGADMNGNLLDNIDKFAGAFHDAGIEADQFMAILAETRNGLFDERAMKSITDAGSRIRSMSKNAEESLEAIGISAKKMQDDLANGNITMLEAIQQVTDKMGELPPNCQEVGDVMKNVFGRKAAMAGEEILRSISYINGSLDEAKKSMGELGRVNEEQLNAQKELQETLSAVFKMSGTSFEVMITSAKTFVTVWITRIIKGCVEIVNWFIRLYNNSMLVRGALSSIGNYFKALWEIAKFVLTQVIDAFKAAGSIIEDVFTMNWGKIADDWTEGMKVLGKNLTTMAKNIASNTAEAYNKTMSDELKEFSVGLNADLGGLGASDRTPVSEYNPVDYESEADKKAREKAAKEAEKAAKEELKRIQALEDSKIAIMEDGHEKELALIRQKFKKKLDEVTGDTDVEIRLRVQMTEECMKEISECETKYRKELTEINIENRLASVRKGSKEELDLRLAQIEIQYAEELEAAKKTGADIELIAEKYEAKRTELERNYTDTLIKETEDRYAGEEVRRSETYSNQVNALKEKYTKELELAKGNTAKQEQLRKQLDDDLYELDVAYSRESAQAAVDMIEEILNLSEMSAEDRLRWERELTKAKIDLYNQDADAAIDAAERKKKKDAELLAKRKENISQWLNVAADAIGNISGLINTLYDTKIERLEADQEANASAGEKEKERIDDLVSKKVITEEEGEARKRAAEAQTARKNEEFEKKKAALVRKQAIFQKATDLAQAGIATALAITQALPNLVLAAIAGTMAAFQMARIAATPIPAYARGTERHKGGPALVGDAGRHEVIVFRGEAFLTPDRPTIMEIPEGARVIPDVNIFGGNVEHAVAMSVGAPKQPSVVVNNDYSELKSEVRALGNLIRQQTKMQRRIASDQQYEIFKKGI